MINNLKSQKPTDCNGLFYHLKLKNDIRYSVRSNANIRDGLINGADGILSHVTINENTKMPEILWLRNTYKKHLQKIH